jgi:outer membrane protein TolC
MRPLAMLLAAALAAAPVLPAAAKDRAPAPAPTDTLRLTVDDAVARALATSAGARAALAGVRVAEGQVKEATAEALPQVTGAVTYNRKFDSIFRSAAGDTSLGGLADLFSKSSFAAVHGWTADLTATQTLWSGRVGAGIAAARSVRKYALAARDESLADVAVETRAGYLEVLYAAAVHDIAEEGLAQSRAHLAQVRLFQAQGARSEYDLLQAQVDVANQEPAVVAARNAEEQALLRLRQLLKLPADQPLALTTPLAFESGQVPVLAADPGDGSARAALRGADATVSARRQAVSAEKWARWPRLAASATVSHQAYPDEAWPVRRNEFVRAIDGSLRLEWPLFQGGRTFGSVQRATAELRQAEAQRDQTYDDVAFQARQARQEVDRALATLAARRGTVQLAARAHHLATVRWRNGLSTQLEVSDARLRLQTAEVNEVAAIKDYRLALLRLERATGVAPTLANRALDDLTSILPADGER